MDALLRHWAMLRMIPRYPRRIDTGRIRQGLERLGYTITLRSIQRDLNKLAAVLPLSCDESKPQGWWWQAEAGLLEIPGLDPQAALVFKMAEQHLAQVLPASTLDALRPWFRAAHGVLDAQSEGVGDWTDKVRILPGGPPLIPPVVDPGVQSAIHQGLFENRRLALSYKPRGKPVKDYEMSPLAIVQHGHLIYIVCTLWDYGNPMLMLMHRIKTATVLDKPIEPPAGFQLDRYIEEGELSYRLGNPVKLVAAFSPEAASLFEEAPMAVDQRLIALSDGRIRLTATVPNTRELRSWLKGFGSAVEVLRPVGWLDF